MSNSPGGWRIDLDEFIQKPETLKALPNESPILAMRGMFKAVTLDPRQVLKVENQGSVGSCQGHAITSCCEWCYCIATGSADVQLSRAAGYYLSQELDGIRGDSGSTVASGVKLAKNGIGEEQWWKYSGRYDASKPATYQQYVESAKRYPIAQSFNMTSYEGIKTFLGSGQGAVEIGITWNSSVDRALVESYSGSGGGGHALAFISLSDRKDTRGDNYLWLLNSWGSSWGNNGWAEVSPTAVKQMLNSRFTVMIGISDMPNVKPREYTLADLKKDLRI